MKIAMIGHKRIPSREGGVEVVVEKLARHMVKKGHEVDVYNRSVFGKKKVKKYKDINIINIPTLRGKIFNAIVYSFLASLWAIFKSYDVIHYHAEGSCVAIIFPYLFRKKTVVTIHGLDWKRSKWGNFASRYILFGEKMAVKYADTIVVLSNNMKEYFKKTYNKDVVYIPNGIEKPVIRKADIIKTKYNIDKNEYILFLARLVPEKGLHYLIEAYKMMKSNVKLVIAGTSSHTRSYEKNIREMIKDDDRIIMTGFVQGSELDELYSNALLYVLPSDVEGMPMSLLEALSYNCPCLVSDIKENTEAFGEYVETFHRGDINDLLNKLEYMIREIIKYNINYDSKIDKDFMKSSCIHQFDWDNICERYIEVYKKMRNNEVVK